MNLTPTVLPITWRLSCTRKTAESMRRKLRWLWRRAGCTVERCPQSLIDPLYMWAVHRISGRAGVARERGDEREREKDVWFYHLAGASCQHETVVTWSQLLLCWKPLPAVLYFRVFFPIIVVATDTRYGLNYLLTLQLTVWLLGSIKIMTFESFCCWKHDIRALPGWCYSSTVVNWPRGCLKETGSEDSKGQADTYCLFKTLVPASGNSWRPNSIMIREGRLALRVSKLLSSHLL